jgi:hypothetical protein
MEVVALRFQDGFSQCTLSFANVVFFPVVEFDGAIGLYISCQMSVCGRSASNTAFPLHPSDIGQN